MKAAVLHGREDVRVEDLAESAPGPGEVRVRVEAALTCGTDLKVFKRGYHARMITPPAVFGHEFAGVITAVGEGAAAGAVGDRVVAANSAPCGGCFFCRRHQENLCEDLLFLNGAYAESICVPARIVARNLLFLRPSTSFQTAALSEPLACVVQGIEDCALQTGERVLVIGSGPIGLMFVALARHAGCVVSVAGRGQERLAAAQRLGATSVADGAGAISGGAFDVVIEAVGKVETWEAAVRLVRKGGRVNFFGGCPSGTAISLDTGVIHYSNLILRASFHHTPRTFRRALQLLEDGIIRAEDFVDGRCALSGLPGLFQSMATGNRAVKTLIDPRG